MQAVTTIGLDIAKSVFQVHGIDDNGKTVIRQQLRRSRLLAFFKKLPPCLRMFMKVDSMFTKVNTFERSGWTPR